MKKLIALTFVFALGFTACEKKDDSKKAEADEAAAKQEKADEKEAEESPLSAANLQKAATSTNAFTDWNETRESLEENLGEPTHVSLDTAYFWANVDGETCHQFQLQLTGDGQVGPNAYMAFEKGKAADDFNACSKRAKKS